jgi:HK97 family phage major capsid protein
MSEELVKRLVEKRAVAWEQAKNLLDVATLENRDLTAEESAQFDRINADIDALDSRAKTVLDVEARERAITESRSALGLPQDFTPAEIRQAESDAQIIRSIALGERRSASFEHRDVTTGSTGAPVPTNFYDRLVEQLVIQGPMLDGNVVTILTTDSGNNLQVPRQSGFTAPAITSEGSSISESDPTFSAFITLGAFKYAATLQLSREVVEDSGINLLDFIARQAATGMGTAVNAGLTTGTGTTQPKGIVAASTLGVTGGTGVSGVPTADNLIDLVYSVGSPYRRRGASWQMRAATLGAIRKLKDTTNQYIWQPSLQVGQPDTLLGFPVYENPDVVATGTAAKSVIFGDASSYFVRQVRGIEVARDDSIGFVSDLITFRITWRGDGNLPDTAAVKHFIGAAT